MKRISKCWSGCELKAFWGHLLWVWVHVLFIGKFSVGSVASGSRSGFIVWHFSVFQKDTLATRAEPVFDTLQKLISSLSHSRLNHFWKGERALPANRKSCNWAQGLQQKVSESGNPGSICLKGTTLFLWNFWFPLWNEVLSHLSEVFLQWAS